ncbi:MAG: hypothetical protein EOR45_22155, partial [Mesorhizobium sp.]
SYSSRVTPKIGIDFRKGSCAHYKCYSVLCASNRTRGAVVSSSIAGSAVGLLVMGRRARIQKRRDWRPQKETRNFRGLAWF